MKYSKLFDKVCYVSKGPGKITDINDNEITVIDTFPYDSKSKSSPKTAIYWASTWSSRIKDPVAVERDNTPFKIKLISLDVRSEGGRAYKVIDDEFRRFDLREDQLIEAIKMTGINAGGSIPGCFVWGSSGSQTKMVLVGGKLHSEMVKNTEDDRLRKLQKPSDNSLSPTKFQFGHVYEKRNGKSYMFLGRLKHSHSKNKIVCAFIKMPDVPADYTLYVEDMSRLPESSWTPRQDLIKKQVAVAKNWNNLSWEQRCEWDWKHRLLDGSCKYEEISLSTSPEFYRDSGVIEESFARSLRENSEGHHSYFPGAPMEVQPYYTWNHSTSFSTNERDRALHDQKIMQYREEFNKSFKSTFVWM